MVGCVQLFSDKFQTLLNVGRLIVYLLHATLLDSTKRMRRLQILSGATVLAYLYFSFPLDLTTVKLSKSNFMRSSRVAALWFLHECIEMCLSLLSTQV